MANIHASKICGESARASGAFEPLGGSWEGSLLTVRGLSKHYEDFDLRGVDLNVPAGAVVGFVGANGAGKTTTIKAILDLVRPDAGAIGLFGRSIGEMSSQEFAQLKQRVGVVFDACSFPRALRVRDVGTAMRGVYRAWDEPAFAGYLERFGIERAKKVEDLSRGMGMKLMLACALSHGADLLILDEATAGLDPLAREEVLGILRSYLEVDGRGILMSTHITSDLDRIADYVVCIDAGRIAFAVEKDLITDVAGIARLRACELNDVLASDLYAPGELRFQRNPYGVDVLVPDRAAFARAFASATVERATIEEYMALTLKGETR